MKTYITHPWIRFLIRTVIVGAAYFLVLYPTQQLLPLMQGTEIRPAAFIPIVGGIVWGWPAALGVFLANLLSDFLIYPTTAAVIGSIANGLAAVFAHRCYFAIPRARQGEYIYHLRSLLRYLFACVVSQITLCTVISLSLLSQYSTDLQSTFPVLFLNNMESCVLFGLPVMLFVPLFMQGDYPQKDRGEPGRYALFAIPAIIPAAALFLSGRSSADVLMCTMALCLVLMAVFDVFAPELIPKEDKQRFSSLRSRCFRTVMVTAELLSLLFCGMVILILSPFVPEKLVLWKNAYMLSAVILTLMTVAFSVIIGIFQKKIAAPLYHIARDIRTDEHTDKNDIEVLQDRLNFVAESADPLHGNEFVLYIGLTTRTGEHSFSYDAARSTVDAICLRHVSGYISSLDAVGGYHGEDASVSEKTLKYTIFGATDEQIRAIAEEVGCALEQESILIEKNRTARYYFYPQKTTV